MFDRTALPLLESALCEFPAMALLGPRQIGKTTLAQHWAERHGQAV